jgi:DNA-binding LytR/AlgR family response regulator
MIPCKLRETTMNILILEDEQEATHRLTTFLERYGRENNVMMRVLGTMESVWEAVAYFQGLLERRLETPLQTEHTEVPAPDVLFVDIHLADGLSFEIFRHVEVTIPVIFTTAYDEYALHAFHVHSIAYLLKPFGYADVEAALNKLSTYKTLFRESTDASNDAALREFRQTLGTLGTAISTRQKRFKTRFLLNVGESLAIVRTSDVHYFLADGKIVTMTLQSGRKYIADNTLDELESLLSPDEFFRISRKCILRADAVAGAEPYFNGRLTLRLNPQCAGEILVSRERVKEFKLWLEGV